MEDPNAPQVPPTNSNPAEEAIAAPQPSTSEVNQMPSTEPVQVVEPQPQVFGSVPATQPDAIPAPVAPTPLVESPQATVAAAPQPMSDPAQPSVGAPQPQGAPQPAQPAAKQTDVLGIVSIVLFFVGLQLIGLIVGIVGIRKAKKNGYSKTLSVIGTVLNSLILVVIIPILLILILTTTSGIQTKAADAERQADIRALQVQLETYHEQKGAYPTLAEINTPEKAVVLFPSFDKEALSDPKANPKTYVLVASPVAKSYSYEAYGADGLTPCSVASTCKSYVLTATLDNSVNGSMTFVKTNLF